MGVSEKQREAKGMMPVPWEEGPSLLRIPGSLP